VYSDANSPKIVGTFLDVSLLSSVVVETVETNSSSIVQTISLEDVTIGTPTYQTINKPTNLTYTTKVGSDITFSKFDNTGYADWFSFNGVGYGYNSFVETGYELHNDAMRRKESVRVFCFFRRTEDDPGTPETSCTLRTKWDWTANGNSNRWSPEFEAYRPPKILTTTTADLESGFPVVVSNNKVRGHGKAVQFRFGTSEIGKNFDLLGWSVLYAGNTKP
jgi:hypothetical protein